MLLLQTFGDTICAGFANKFAAVSTQTIAELDRLTAPFIVLHGTADKIVPLRASEILIERSGTPASDKKIVTFDGRLHEIQNEPNRDEVLAEIMSWVMSHLDAGAGAANTAL